jgi:hypothetical protein
VCLVCLSQNLKGTHPEQVPEQRGRTGLIQAFLKGVPSDS